MEAVAEAIDISSRAMRNWTTTAPIDKLIGISNFTGIPIVDIVDCFRPDVAPQDEIEPDRN